MKPLFTRLDNKRERFLTVDEVKSLLSVVVEEPSLHLFTLLSLSTGGRLNTIMNIAKKDIDFENNMITLKDIKNDDTYGGFFDDSLKELLLEQVKTLKQNEYIITMNGRTLRRQMSIILTKLFNQELDGKDRKTELLFTR